MKMRLILLLPLALIALKGNLNAASIVNYGTDGDDTQFYMGTPDSDTIKQYSRGGNDTIIYDVSAGADQVFIDGGTGTDTLTVNAGTNQNFTVLNAQGQVLYQQGIGGSVITVRNVECIRVIGPNSEVLFRLGC